MCATREHLKLSETVEVYILGRQRLLLEVSSPIFPDRRRYSMRLAKLFLITSCGLGVLACGGAAVPHAQMTSAEAAVRAAEVGGAPGVPKAELHLKHARDQIDAAKRLIEEGENERALFVLKRAEADAELALALAEEQDARRDAEGALKRIQQMTEQ